MKLFEIITCLAIVVAIILLINVALERQERRECIKWQGWGEKYELFNPSQAQQDQCLIHNITLN